MVQLAAADSLLGQLQRGRGAGFLRALAADPPSLHPLLVECVTDDPRWDSQIETRSDYYAALIIHSGLPLDAFDTYLRAGDGRDPGDPNDLTLETLCALARRGYANAASLLHEYLFYGPCWDQAFEALMMAPDAPVDLPEMDRVICQRFPDDASLDDELAFCYVNEEVQRSWCALNPRVARIFEGHEEESRKRKGAQERLRARCATLSVPELLAAAGTTEDYHIVRSVLWERVSADDLGLLLDVVESARPLLYAVESGRPPESAAALRRAMVAMRGLERLADPVALPAMRVFFESAEEPARGALVAATRVMVALPPEHTLDLARAWLDAPDGWQRHAARRILEEHATIDDVAQLRAALIASLRRDTPDSAECYVMCGIMEVLARFPEAGPYPEAEIVFAEAGYSWTHIFAAQALHGSEPERFERGLAFECLWDCEERVRQIGCKTVSLDLPSTQARLHHISHDPYEDDDVRLEAQRRLAADA